MFIVIHSLPFLSPSRRVSYSCNEIIGLALTSRWSFIFPGEASKTSHQTSQGHTTENNDQPKLSILPYIKAFSEEIGKMTKNINTVFWNIGLRMMVI